MLKANVIAGANAISANGNYCQATCVSLAGPGQAQTTAGFVFDSAIDMFDSGQYLIQTGAGVSAGSVSVAIFDPISNAWIPATTPNSATGAAFTLIATLGANATYNGSLGITGGVFFPAPGIRLVVAGLTGGNITLARLFLTRR